MDLTTKKASTKRALLEKMTTYCIDAIFPKRCLGCKTFDTWLCDHCHTRFGLAVEQKCPICTNVITPNGKVCLKCTAKKETSIDGVFVASYQDAFLKKVIHAYKYRFIKDLAPPLSLLLAQSLQNTRLEAPDIIVPVPLHKRRLRWRGFNQSELLANELDLNIPINNDLLSRTKFTTAQAKIGNRSKRLKHLSGAFSVSDQTLDLSQKKILLVDDITTTATTFNECARALKKAGAKKVTGLALARE